MRVVIVPLGLVALRWDLLSLVLTTAGLLHVIFLEPLLKVLLVELYLVR